MQKSLRIFLLVFAAACLSFTAAYAQPGCLSISTGTVTDVTCFGGANGSITVNISPGSGTQAQPPFRVELYFQDSGGGLTQLSNLSGVTASSVTFTQGNGTLNEPGAEAFGIPANELIDPGSSYRIVVNAAIGSTGVVTCNRKQLLGITVGQPTDPLDASVNSITPACTPGSGAIALDVSGGTGTYTYTWSGPAPVPGNVQDPTGVNAGTYAVTITDANSCVFNLLNIVVPGPPDITLGPNPSICAGTTSSTIIYTSTSGSPTLYRIDWNAGGPADVSSTALPASPIPITGIPLAPATYSGTLYVGNSTCESAGDPISVIVNPLPTATINYAGNPFCATGVANVTQTGQPSGSYTSSLGLSLNGTTGAINLATSTPGTYTVTYSFTNGTCPSTTTTNVTINALPTATISYPGTPFCATGTANVTQTGQGGGSYSAAAGLSINVSSGQINLTASTPGTYTVTYSFSDGTCPNTTTTSVTISALPTATITYPGSPFCAAGLASVNQTGTAGGSYASSLGLSINTTTGAINLATSTPGTYTVTYSFTNGTCPNTTTTNVTINALPTATISYPGSPFCATGIANVTQTGQGGGSYSAPAGVSINTTTGAIDLAASTPGTYTVTYSFSDGTCPNTTTTSVTINALPTAAIIYPGSPFCATGIASVNQTGQGGGSYSPVAGLSINTTTGEIDLAASTPGSYTVTYSFTNGSCPNTTTTNVTINTSPSADLSGSPSICSGQTAGLTVNFTGTAPWTIVYTDGSSNFNATTSANPFTLNVSPSATTAYSLISVTDATCSGSVSGSASVTINTVSITAPPTSICENGGPVDLTTIVSATPSGGSFTFSGTAVSGNMFNPGGLSGLIQITVNYTDLSSCAAPSATLDLTVTTALTMVVPASPVQICQGAGLVDLDNYVSGTTGPFSYSGNVAITGGHFFDPAGLTGIQNIVVDYAGPLPCTAPQVNFDFDVVTSIPPLTIDGSTSVCASAAPFDLSPLATSSVAGGSYLFTGPGVTGTTFNPNGFTGPTTVMISVTYTLPGCGFVSGSIPIAIEDPTTCLPNCFAFTVEVDTQTHRPSCNGGADGVIALKVTALNTPNLLVTVYNTSLPQPAPLPDASGSVFVFSNLSEGTYEYRLEDENGTFCVQPFVWEAVEDIQATLVSDEDSPCFGVPAGSAIINATGSSTGQYFYSVDGTSWNEFVPGNQISGLPGNGTYNIRIGGSENDPCYEEVSVTIATLGTSLLDTLYVSPVNGFPAVSYPESPIATRVIGIDGSGAPPYEIQLRLVEPPDGIEVNPPFVTPWLPVNETTPLGIPQKQVDDLYAGVYELAVRDQIGCERIFTFIIGIDDRVFIPNIFTPNKGDNLNSTFFIRNLPGSGSKLQVNDRWGKEVYSSNNYNPETLWDGGESPDGVYYYRLQIKGGKTYTGWVEILRGTKP